jgi:hypothetical protein
MDPYQAYLDMFAAMRDGDHATAREHAIELGRWIDQDGFIPYQVQPIAFIAYVKNVLYQTRHVEMLEV